MLMRKVQFLQRSRLKVHLTALQVTTMIQMRMRSDQCKEKLWGSTSSDDDDVNRSLKQSVQGKVLGKTVTATLSGNLGNVAVTKKSSETSSDSTSSSDDGAGKNLKQGTNKSLTMPKGEKLNDCGKILDKRTPKEHDGSSDSESDIHETPAKKTKLQVHHKATMAIRKKAADTSSSDSSDSDSSNVMKLAKNMQKKSVTISSGAMMRSSSSPDSDELRLEVTGKTKVTKAVRDKTFSNEDTSSDSSSNNEVRKAQIAAVADVKQSKKPPQQVAVQPKVKSSSDSSSDSETVVPEKVARKQQQVRLQHQQEVTRKQKLMDNSLSDSSSSDDAGVKTAEMVNKADMGKIKNPSESSLSLNKVATTSLEHLHQKAVLKLPSNSKPSVESDSETSSDSNCDEATLKPQLQTVAEVQINGKPHVTEDSATSSDSSSDSDMASKERNFGAIFKQANKGTSKDVIGSTKKAATKQFDHSLSGTDEGNDK
ncbi:hypothetical protein WUBG_15218, partial [Wuchereria bancrofti]